MSIVSQLQLATADLDILIHEVTCFVDWWGIVKTSLTRLQIIVPQIELNESARHRIEGVKESWERVSEGFSQYQNMVRLFRRGYSIGFQPIICLDQRRGRLLQ